MIYAICEKRGWVRPRVYQGKYNPIVRGGEEGLFLVLRRWGMGFWAYRYVEAIVLRDLLVRVNTSGYPSFSFPSVR